MIQKGTREAARSKAAGSLTTAHTVVPQHGTTAPAVRREF
jgi:hypothetical protein